MEGINFKYDGNYFVAEITDENCIINFQMEQLLNNKIDYLVETKRQGKNNMTYLYYDISTRKPLKSILSKGRITESQFYSMTECLIKSQMEVQDYQLPTAGIMLDFEMVFIQSGSSKLEFIYAPIFKDDAEFAEIINFVKKLFNNTKFDSNSAKQNVFQLLNEGILNIDEFERKFAIIKNRSLQTNEYEESVEEQNETDEAENDNVKADDKIFGFKPFLKTGTDNEENSIKNKNDAESKFKIPGIPNKPINIKDNINKDRNLKEGNQEKEKKKKTYNFPVIMIGLSVLVIVIFYGIYDAGVFPIDETTGKTDSTCFILVPILLFAVNYMVYKKLIKKDDSKKAAKEKLPKEHLPKDNKIDTKRNNKKELSKLINEVEMESPKKLNIPTASDFDNQKYKKENAEENLNVVEYSNGFNIIEQDNGLYSKADEKNDEIGGIDEFNSEKIDDEDEMPEDFGTETEIDDIGLETEIDDTVLMAKTVYIINGNGERTDITISPFRIGKIKNDANLIIDNTKVSRKHAEIIQHNDKVFVVDLGSSNGTYVNNTRPRINSNEEYELFDGDIITFANEEFVIHF